MKDRAMPTVTHEARIEDLPQAWRKDFDAGTRVHVTIRAETELLDDHARREADYQRRKAAIDQAAGIWEDRTDEEIDALRADIREANHARFDRLIRED